MNPPEIRHLDEKKFIGKRILMSLANNRTFELWSNFMPWRNTVANVIGSELYSIEIYPGHYFSSFNATTIFEKWAAVEVCELNEIPADMETLMSPAGLYAVFLHKGPASEGANTYNHIFSEWLPASGYKLDDRPHFAVMGEKYKHDQHDSEEELWIPVRPE